MNLMSTEVQRMLIENRADIGVIRMLEWQLLSPAWYCCRQGNVRGFALDGQSAHRQTALLFIRTITILLHAAREA